MDAASGTESLTGRQLDAAVAERVMGWRKDRVYDGEFEGTIRWQAGKAGDSLGFIYTGDRAGDPWKPSEDIAAVWPVVERMTQLGFNFEISGPHAGQYHVHFVRGLTSEGTARDRGEAWAASLALLPEAIARAAYTATEGR